MSVTYQVLTTLITTCEELVPQIVYLQIYQYQIFFTPQYIGISIYPTNRVFIRLSPLLVTTESVRDTCPQCIFLCIIRLIT